jgi:hypothetical protein
MLKGSYRTIMNPTEGSKSNIPLRATFTSDSRRDVMRASGVNPAHMSRKCYAKDSRMMCVG